MTSMKSYQAIFFWFGGVLVQPVSDLAAQSLYGRPIERIDLQARRALRELDQELAIGQLDGRSYGQEAIRRGQLDLAVEDLIPRMLAACSLRPGVFEISERLPAGCARWLVVDYPRDWFGQITSRLDIPARFPEERTVFIADCGLDRLAPDIFYQLVRLCGHSMKDCMIVDGATPRAVQAVRHGFSATIFVDARRLVRDFRLRQLIP
jgi:hypothetical protein